MLTMYNLCIGELEQIVDEFVQREGIDKITIENVVLDAYRLQHMVSTTFKSRDRFL